MAIDPARAKSLFLAASDLTDAAERAAYLERACGGDAELRGRIEALLLANDAAPLPPAAAENATSALPPECQPATEDYGDPSARVGSVVAGKYKLIEAIGEGGMGSVFMAQQTEPVKRAVAVKVIKAGMDSRAVLARFEAERQALAMMDHPNIARVLDAGTTDGGRPFFVMELVKGTPITRYCDDHKLTPRQRLELFVTVCQAIQHAHQKGIIHRDIKPSNVLVALFDDRPVPKVIDFGVAKAAGQSLTDKTLMTGFGAIVGTPEYMSPEQASLNNLDIDTRSDVYSLGVLLYELLTGTTPVDRKGLGEAAILEILRIVREVEAPRPSAKLSSCDTLPSVAANRGTEPARLSRLMKGELDWLVMKALEKDRTRRYDTANALSRDIQRYLADEVVEARPPSVGYRLRKFVRRHKGQVIAASVVMLTLIGGIVGTSLGLLQANQSAEEERLAKIAAQTATKKEQLAAAGEKEARQAERERGDDLKYQLGVSSMVLASAAYDNRDVVLAAERLEKVPEKQRGWEWRYLKQQARGGLFTLYGHTGEVLSVAFSPDGERIVTRATTDSALNGPCEVKMWDARTGTAVLELNNLAGSDESQLFSLGGTRLATAGHQDNTARLWDAHTGKLQRELKHPCLVVRLALSPDGSRLATICLDGIMKVWDAETGKLQSEFKGSEFKGTSEGATVAFSPDGTRIFSDFLENKKALVLDAQTGKPLLELTGYDGRRGFAFSPDGTRIVAGGVKQAKVWDAEKGGPPLFALKGIRDLAACVAFSPDGTRIVTGGGEIGKLGPATVCDARTGMLLFSLKGRPSVSYSPDGTRIVTVGGQKGAHEATVWDARTGTELLVLTGHVNPVLCASFSPDGTRIVTGSLDGTAKVWDARTGTPRIEMNRHRGELYSVAVSPDGTRIVSGGSGEPGKPGAATVWDARTGTALLELKGFAGTVKSVAFSRDGTQIVTGGYRQTERDQRGKLAWTGEVRVWDAQTGAALLELKGFKEGVNSVAVSPDGTRIITAGGGPYPSGRTELKVWDATTGAVLLDLTQPGAVPRAPDSTGGIVSFSPDGTRCVAGGFVKNGSVGTEATVLDARTGTALLELKGHVGTVLCLAFSRDGTRIVTGGGDRDRKALVWDAETGTPLPFELKGHTSAVQCVAFSPDGKRIVTGSDDRTVRVWDARTGTALVELKGFTDRVASVAFSPDGTRIVTADLLGAVAVWDAPSVKTPPTLRGRRNFLLTVGFSPDGARIVTGESHGLLTVWDTSTGTALLDLKGHTSGVNCVAFSPDGKRIVSGSGAFVQPWKPLPVEVKVWDAETGTEKLALKGLTGSVKSVAFSQDGTRILTGSQDGTAKVWEARTGTPLLELKGRNRSAVFNVAFSPDGTRIITVSSDGKKVWDARTGKEMPGETIPNTVADPRISPDGRLFAHVDAGAARVELVSLKPDEGELAYWRLHVQPNVERYREGYLAARAAKDDFAARFYLDRLIEFSTTTNRPDEAENWRAERAKYLNTAPPTQEMK